MSVSKDDLIRSFSNGSLPDGTDFSNLINFFTPETEFRHHKAEFDEWRQRPDVALGPEADGWTLALEDGHVWLAPNDHAPKPPSTPGGPPAQIAPDVSLWGWAGMSGRMGGITDPAQFVKPSSDLVPRLPEALSMASDGTYRTILAPPGRPCALELVAATNRQPAAQQGVWRTVTRALGFGAPDNAVLHAVATANGANRRPTLAVSCHPGVGSAWTKIAVAGLAGLALLAAFGGHLSAPEGIADLDDLVAALKGAFAAIEKMLAQLLALIQGAGGTAPPETSATATATAAAPLGGWVRDGLIGVAVLGALVFLNRRRHRAKGAISARWKRSAGSALAGTARYELQIRGPDLGRLGGDTKLYFHVTALWG